MISAQNWSTPTGFVTLFFNSHLVSTLFLTFRIFPWMSDHSRTSSWTPLEEDNQWMNAACIQCSPWMLPLWQLVPRGSPWTRLVICSLFWSSCGMTRYLHYPPECVSVSTSALFQGVPWYYWTSVICTGDHCLSWVRCQEVLHHWMPFGQDPLLTVWTPLPYRMWNNGIPATPLWMCPLCIWDRSFQTLLESMLYRSPRADQTQLVWTDSWS